MLNRNILMDGHYFIGLLEKSTQQINALCDEFQVYINESSDVYVKNEDTQGQIQTAIGKGQLLINQKFKQFRGLCEKNINAKNDTLQLKEGEFVTRDEDLAGFWDMVYLQVEDINKMFEKLSELRKNNWIIESKPVVKPAVKLAPKKKAATGSKTTESAASKARAEAARQRIQEMKKKAALGKNQNNEQQNPQIIN